MSKGVQRSFHIVGTAWMCWIWGRILARTLTCSPFYNLSVHTWTTVYALLYIQTFRMPKTSDCEQHCDLPITTSVAKCVIGLQKLIITWHQELYLSKTKQVALLLHIQPQRLLLVPLFFYFHTEFVNMVTTAKHTKLIKCMHTSCEDSHLLTHDAG